MFKLIHPRDETHHSKMVEENNLGHFRKFQQTALTSRKFRETRLLKGLTAADIVGEMAPDGWNKGIIEEDDINEMWQEFAGSEDHLVFYLNPLNGKVPGNAFALACFAALNFRRGAVTIICNPTAKESWDVYTDLKGGSKPPPQYASTADFLKAVRPRAYA